MAVSAIALAPPAFKILLTAENFAADFCLFVAIFPNVLFLFSFENFRNLKFAVKFAVSLLAFLRGLWQIIEVELAG